ncbi:MAG: DUF481 domain-containing protein [Mariprofundales bacterium]|nr:DUF481 domain-containing protein [Mariprofundales bacterium]
MALLLFSAPADAIVNIEDSALAHPNTPLSATLDLAVNGTAGNSNKIGSSADLGIQWHHNPHQLLLWLGYYYGRSQQKRNANRGFAHLRYRHHFTPRYAVESFTQWQKDEFARLNRRILLGGGVRITEGDQHVGIGAFHEREVLQPSGAERNNLTHTTWRASLYLALQHRFTHATVSDTLYYQPAMRHLSNDYRLLNEAALRVEINKNISLKLSLESRQDSRPPTGVKQLDLRYTTSFSYALP